MNKAQQILSDITVFNKYAKYIPNISRRETWYEICIRNMEMHIAKFPFLADAIRKIYNDYIFSKKILPSMRSMQFGGRPIELSNNRMFNCAFIAADDPAVFSETMFLLLGGSGVGYSVQEHHVDKLPLIVGPSNTTQRILINDSIEGWADTIKTLMAAYFNNTPIPKFDYRDIRPKGAALITSGGKAPGPEPLKNCVTVITTILNNAIGRKLTTLEVHDIMCHIADAVLSGGIRRAALIALFTLNDESMLTAKSGKWYETNPQRARANNSAVLLRDQVTKSQFEVLWDKIQSSRAGEPGISWTNNIELGFNPCHEISLKSGQFCNLVEINASDIITQQELNDRARAAAFIGTLQASYTDFHYLRPLWKENTDQDALLGVGMTGVASNTVTKLNLIEAAKIVLEENARVAPIIGINVCARGTTIKPGGTSSLAVGSSSGIHNYHSLYYIRRMRVGKNEAMYSYMVENIPALVEDCAFKPDIEAVMSFPQKSPDTALLRDEPVLEFLARVKKFNMEWVAAGYRSGDNQHNVSCTVSLKDDEWDVVGNWMWENRLSYTGISVLPYDGGSYIQAPFEDCSEEVYNELSKHLSDIDLSQVVEDDDNTQLSDQAACAGNLCALT